MLTFNVNNQNTLSFNQFGHDKAVKVTRHNGIGKAEEVATIPPGDIIMLLNLYKYIKDNDIRNDFINPTGKNKE